MEAQSLALLDLGCGEKKKNGWIGLDIRELPGVDIVHDIEETPWPLPDNSCRLIQMSHLWEHIKPFGRVSGEEPRTFAVMAEMWRVLAPGGQVWITLPYGWSHGFVQDPTHCNPANEHTWEYWDPSKPLYDVYKPKPWRIVKVESQQQGNMLAVMEPIEKNGAALNTITLPEQAEGGTKISVADAFHVALYNARTPTGDSLPFYGGRRLDKSPLDLWRYVEILERVKPCVLIECGTANGASAHFLADQMRRHCDHAVVLSIDIDDGTVPFDNNPSRTNPGERPKMPGVEYFIGSSTSAEIAKAVGMTALKKRRSKEYAVIVALDSNHAFEHVRLELDIYHPLVTPGSYLVVEDSDINGHPVYPGYGPGPHEALANWLPDHPEFEVDTEIAGKFLGVTANTWLRRKK